MADMLVNLYAQEWDVDLTLPSLEGIRFLRPLVPNKDEVLKFVQENFGTGWTNECEITFTESPARCWIAVKKNDEGENEVVGFACYDATGRGYFGPTGVREDMRGRKIGRTLLRLCMQSMRDMGYGYAIIGWAADKAKPMYARDAGAVEMPNWEQAKSIYRSII